MTRRSLMLIFFPIWIMSCTKDQTPQSILVFTKTNEYIHKSIPQALIAIKKFGKEQNILVNSMADSLIFTDEILKNYAAVVFLNTSGNVLGPGGKQALRTYIENGGGFAGIPWCQ